MSAAKERKRRSTLFQVELAMGAITKAVFEAKDNTFEGQVTAKGLPKPIQKKLDKLEADLQELRDKVQALPHDPGAERALKTISAQSKKGRR